MNGAESLVRTLLSGGVDTCFANPGTSEMHFVAALDSIEGMRCVPALFEGVVTGAADGYARMAGKPAATLLHCGPGLANGLANLHNARRANTPIVNLVGDQASYHTPLDPPLTADTEVLARTVSAWTRTSTSAAHVGADAAEAIQASKTGRGGTATLVLPSDVCWSDGGQVGDVVSPPPRGRVDDQAISVAARLLRSGESTVIMLDGDALLSPQLEVATRIVAATGARLFAPTQIARIERGRGRCPINRLPYVIDQAIAALAGTRNLILVGAKTPVTFFAYPGKPGIPHPADSHVHILARPDEDLPEALHRLADALRAGPADPPAVSNLAATSTHKITPESVAHALAGLLPEHAVVVNESISFGRAFYNVFAHAAPHDWLQLTGGAIGDGIPMATGAAIGAPGRRVVNLQADGSALYTAQGLWTQARENLDVTTVILANRKYAILLGELVNVGAKVGRKALDMMSLENPVLDWLALAKGYGVEARRATSIAELSSSFAAANSRRGPFLIELVID